MLWTAYLGLPFRAACWLPGVGASPDIPPLPGTGRYTTGAWLVLAARRDLPARPGLHWGTVLPGDSDIPGWLWFLAELPFLGLIIF